MNFGPSADECFAMIRFEFGELGTIDRSGNDLANVEWDLDIGRNNSKEFFLGINRFFGQSFGLKMRFGRLEGGDKFAGNADAIELILSQIIRNT